MPDRPINGTPEQLSVATVPRYAVRLKATPIPGANWDDAPLFCLKLNDEWVSHVIGVLTALDQPDTWIGTPEEIYAARQQVNEIILALMEQCDPMSNCCPEPLTRITEDGVLQVSYDGGMTWQDATTEDPRNTAPQLPPLSGANGSVKRCNAANNVLGQFKDGIQTFEGYFDTTGTLIGFVTAVAGFIAAVIFAPLAVPIIVGAIIALMSAVWGAGKVAYSGAFNDTVYGDLLCILYCHVQNDGTFTSEGFAAIRADINSHFDSIARDAFNALLSGVSLAGLNNLAKIPTGSSASCDSCECDDECNLLSWSIYGEAGTIDAVETDEETGEDYILATSVLSSLTGSQTVGLTTGDEMKCCYIDHTEPGGNMAWVECGETIPEVGGSFPHGGLGIHCYVSVNTFLIYGGTEPFQVKVFLRSDACEE